MPLASRRFALIAGLVALVPLTAEGGNRKKRRRTPRRCPKRPETPCPTAGDLRECHISCETVTDCADNAVACLHERCRYCPSEQWALVVNNLNVFGGKVCVRDGFTDLRAGCEPW